MKIIGKVQFQCTIIIQGQGRFVKENAIKYFVIYVGASVALLRTTYRMQSFYEGLFSIGYFINST